MKSGTFSKRSGAATKGFKSCEFWFQVAFFNLNTVLYFHSMYVWKKIISKFRWHCISVWSLVNDHRIRIPRHKAQRLVRHRYYAQSPNYVWHVDGYDKLKPYGFCIHGAIDGYSRRILWL